MNVPPPATASDSIDSVADRVSWLRDYRGGDCFYATVTSATDKAIEIEGFGTSVAPFEQLLGAFQAKFNVEPDVSVRLIEPAQCEITNFLHALNARRQSAQSWCSTVPPFRTARRSAVRWKR